MKNNLLAITSGICLLASSAQAQNYSEKEMALAYNNTQRKAPVEVVKTFSGEVTSSPEIVDYPTVSYPETTGFAAEKEKAFYHLSWQVAMRENLSYTEVQSSSDGINFTTVGFVLNDGSQKNGSFDYFVPSDKNNTSTFRLVQYGLNAQQHISEILRVK